MQDARQRDIGCFHSWWAIATARWTVPEDVPRGRPLQTIQSRVPQSAVPKPGIARDELCPDAIPRERDADVCVTTSLDEVTYVKRSRKSASVTIETDSR
jgi:hypothetical protein